MIPSSHHQPSKGSLTLSELIQSEVTRVPTLEVTGRLTRVEASRLYVVLPGVNLGSRIQIQRQQSHPPLAPLYAQVVGIDEYGCVASPLGRLDGIQVGAVVRQTTNDFTLVAGPHLLGCAIDSAGEVQSRFCNTPALVPGVPSGVRSLAPSVPNALARGSIEKQFVTGIRAIDGFLSLGRGQRMGIFAEPGVGKSSLLGSLVHGCIADVVVVALVGERGREVGEFIHDTLSAEAKRRAIVVYSTSDEPALARIHASLMAMAVAEYFRDFGLNVLFLMDSLTRLCRAYREIGLIAGEAAVRKGYPPSIFSRLPEFLERAGNNERGSITALYTVLQSGDIDEDPMVEEIKSLTDGHIVLRRKLAERAHFPAIDILQSLSRLAFRFQDQEIRASTQQIRRLLSRLESDREILLFGGTADPELTLALEREPEIINFLQQAQKESSSLEDTRQRLITLSRVE